jgi:hypothetical protein
VEVNAVQTYSSVGYRVVEQKTPARARVAGPVGGGGEPVGGMSSEVPLEDDAVEEEGSEGAPEPKPGGGEGAPELGLEGGEGWARARRPGLVHATAEGRPRAMKRPPPIPVQTENSAHQSKRAGS